MLMTYIYRWWFHIFSMFNPHSMGEMLHFDPYVFCFQIGWLNHQLLHILNIELPGSYIYNIYILFNQFECYFSATVQPSLKKKDVARAESKDGSESQSGTMGWRDSQAV